MTLCLVEDDVIIQKRIAEKLKHQGYSIDSFDSAEPVIKHSTTGTIYDLYIVDIMLPGKDNGLTLCRKIRESSPTVPILILSALSEPTYRIDGLKVGADDYLTKPFDMEELLLRVKGMLKRRGWYRDQALGNLFSWDTCHIDFINAIAKNETETFQLTEKECMIMKFLIEKEGEVVSREDILDTVWGYHVFPSNRTIDNFIMRLRRYFEKDPKNPKYLHSIRGVGYKFTR